MRSSFLLAAILALSLSVGLTAAAQAKQPPVSVTLGAGAVRLAEAYGPGIDRTQLQYGGILSIPIKCCFALEGRGHYMRADRDESIGGGHVALTHGEANLTWFLTGEGRFSPYLTIGGGAARMVKKNEPAGNGGAGFRVSLSDKVAIRADVRALTFQIPGSTEDDYRTNIEAFAGISFGFFGKPKDTDRDGIPDKVDACADTPLGARVDVRGCPIDGDGDTVPDGLDQCAGTPTGATVDATGCPHDADKDGVLDGLDKCPSTPLHARVDARGCPTDSDGDGVFDGLDQCESTPAGCKVDRIGCPTDADKDGVCDGLDQCPDTPANVKVDRRGCAIVVSEKETEMLETGMIRLQNINFAPGKAVLTPDSYSALDEVGGILSHWPELHIEIGGHTDSRGAEAANKKLSEERAQAVLAYLLDKFPDINAAQIEAAGYGESKPIADNGTELGRAKNRRVEFRVLNTEVLKREKEQKKLVPK